MNNWTIDQTKELFDLCGKAKQNGESLSAAFAIMSEKTGRSVNSVRNYYYSQAKTFELVPEVAVSLGIRAADIERERFVTFTDGEVRTLIEKILIECGKGKSVRRAIYELSRGDAKTALRYQNKYRSVLRSHKPLVEDIMRDLQARGVAYRDPYAKYERDNFEKLTAYLAALDERKVGKFLSIIEKLT